MMRGHGGWDRASPRHKGKKISSQKNSSLSRWIPSIAGTFCFPALAQDPGWGRPLWLKQSRAQQPEGACQVLPALGGPECSEHPPCTACWGDGSELEVKAHGRGGGLLDDSFAASLDFGEVSSPWSLGEAQYFLLFLKLFFLCCLSTSLSN